MEYKAIPPERYCPRKWPHAVHEDDLQQPTVVRQDKDPKNAAHLHQFKPVHANPVQRRSLRDGKPSYPQNQIPDNCERQTQLKKPHRRATVHREDTDHNTVSTVWHTIFPRLFESWQTPCMPLRLSQGTKYSTSLLLYRRTKVPGSHGNHEAKNELPRFRHGELSKPSPRTIERSRLARYFSSVFRHPTLKTTCLVL